MAVDIVKYAFIAGEISNTLYGRTDLTKYDLGVSEGTNFFVDYRGGLSTRPGTKFCEHVKADDKATRMATFAFNPEIENTYIVLFGDEYIRFLQGGAYVLEDDLTVTDISSATPAVVTSAGHGLANGRWVILNGKTYSIGNVTTNTFTLHTVPAEDDVDGSTLSLADVSPIYEIESVYTAAQLAGLSFDQYRDRLRITSSDDLPIYDLIRNDQADWELTEVELTSFTTGPTVTSSSTSEAGDAETLFAVSSVYADGSESTIGPVYKVSSMVNYPVTEGSVSINWSPDEDAVSYNVYRSIVSVSETLSYGMELGYAGNTRGTKFTDPNIVVDFGRAPPVNYNPFEPGAITSIKVTAGGSGYTSTTTVGVTGGGSGFVGRVIVDDSGAIVQVDVMNGGSGYVSPSVSFTGAGTGATATATARATSGTYPALSAIYQQRQIFASSILDPITIWGSQYKRFDNFNYSANVLDSDSFEFNLDTAAVAPIRHLVTTRGGLLAMTQDNIWLLSGADGKALTPTNALADPQTYNGVSSLRPIRVGEDLLYVEGKGYAVRLLSYNELSRVYGGEDKSILSSHLFGPIKQITSWGYQESPYKVVWCVRSDGALLAFTIVKSEDVYAWTPCYTAGAFLDVISVQERSTDIVYVTVSRWLQGRWTKTIERFDLRQFRHVENAWCVDCGLALEGIYPPGTLVVERDAEDNYTITSTAASFTGAEGKIIRASYGIFEVTEVLTPYKVALRYKNGIVDWVPEKGETISFPIISGNWSMDTPVSTLSGLDHLEGETVSILGDGNVFPQQVVTNGQVTLPSPVTRAIVGLPFTCKAKTLPLIIPDAGIEAKRKRVVAVGVRLTRSRGLQVGDSYATTYEMKDRTNESWGEPTEMQEGFKRIPIGTTWDEDSCTHFLLTDPLPATLLSLVQETEVGDDSD